VTTPELWDTLAQRGDIELTPEQHAALSRYLDLLEAANAKMNLTRIIDRAAAEVQHVGDALTLLPFLPSGEIRIADVGSGGGVPGIPLAIARPNATVLLIESTKKKAAFLKETIESLALKNASVSEWRAEEVGRSNNRENFDIVIARAVATMQWLAEWCLPLTKVGGKMLAMKGPKVADELPSAKKAIKLAGGGEPIVHPVDLPGTEHRVIVEIGKIRRSDLRLPRPAASAKGKSL
jgi:16S rRNA (guanine527-N7)-methyltransferase